MEIIGAIGASVVIGMAVCRCWKERLLQVHFFSFLAAMIMLYEPLKKITDANNDIQRALAGAERVFELIDSPYITIEQRGHEELAPPF